jgi:hypothetical protein
MSLCVCGYNFKPNIPFEVNRGSCDNAIKVGEYWFKIFWDPWLRGVRAEQKETARVE